VDRSPRRVFDGVPWNLTGNNCIGNESFEDFNQFEREVLEFQGAQ